MNAPQGPTRFRLLGCQGCGSAIVECAFAIAGLPLRYEEVDYSAGSPTRERLLAVNPLGQVPSLVLPDGNVMTESLAMVQLVDDMAPAAQLVVHAGDPQRAAYLRWSTFIVSALYPTWTYGDEPAKWVEDTDGAKQLRESTDRHRKVLWAQVEEAAGAPWFLGGRFSVIDLYIAVMTNWRPGRKWFVANTPRLVAIAERTAATPGVAAVLEKNFS
ncbi:MAG TPA: glutathione S-transferase family protein [Usitatibacter sp.]|nr:glutathione S-transferase family protein [Usitatibacter sp.]